MERFALVELPGDPGAQRGIGAVEQEEVGAHDPPILGERGGERALGRGVLQAGDQQAGRDPAALQRRGRSQQVVVLLDDSVRPGAGSQDDVDGQAGGFGEEVQPEVAGVS